MLPILSTSFHGCPTSQSKKPPTKVKHLFQEYITPWLPNLIWWVPTTSEETHVSCLHHFMLPILRTSLHGYPTSQSRKPQHQGEAFVSRVHHLMPAQPHKVNIWETWSSTAGMHAGECIREFRVCLNLFVHNGKEVGKCTHWQNTGHRTGCTMLLTDLYSSGTNYTHAEDG